MSCQRAYATGRMYSRNHKCKETTKISLNNVVPESVHKWATNAIHREPYNQ